MKRRTLIAAAPLLLLAACSPGGPQPPEAAAGGGVATSVESATPTPSPTAEPSVESSVADSAPPKPGPETYSMVRYAVLARERGEIELSDPSDWTERGWQEFVPQVQERAAALQWHFERYGKPMRANVVEGWEFPTEQVGGRTGIAEYSIVWEEEPGERGPNPTEVGKGSSIVHSWLGALEWNGERWVLTKLWSEQELNDLGIYDLS